MLLHKISILAEEKGWTVAEVERRSGINSKTIYKWDEAMPSADKLARVAKVLGTTVEELLESENETTHCN